MRATSWPVPAARRLVPRPVPPRRRSGEAQRGGTVPDPLDDAALRAQPAAGPCRNAARQVRQAAWPARSARTFGLQAADHQVDAEVELAVHVAAAAEVDGEPEQAVGRVAGDHLGGPADLGQVVVLRPGAAGAV